MRPGDRKQRWQSSCGVDGTIMLFISGFFILAGLTAEKGGWIVIIFGVIGIICAMLDFRDMQRGWRIRYDLPPQYYRDIKSSNPMIREMAEKAAEATSKAVRNPNRAKYAFQNNSRRPERRSR